MFCRYCGKEIRDKAIVCAGCGRPTELSPGGKTKPGAKWLLSTLLLLIAMSVVFPPIGLIFGLLGYRDEHKKVQATVLLTISVFMSLLLLAIVLGL